MDPALVPRLLLPVPLAAVLLALSACAGMSGLGGSSEFKCSAPTGIPCRSVTAVDLADRAGTAPDEPSRSAAERDRRASNSRRPPVPPEAWSGAEVDGPTGQSVRSYHAGARVVALPDGAGPAAIRSAPTQLRMWIAPWKDSDGDLHDESYVFMVIDNGRWLVEHNRERIRKAFAPRNSDSVAGGSAPLARGDSPTSSPATTQPAADAARRSDEVAAAIARSAVMAEAERKRVQAAQAATGTGGKGAQP